MVTDVSFRLLGDEIAGAADTEARGQVGLHFRFREGCRRSPHAGQAGGSLAQPLVVIMDRDREHLLGVVLADDVVVEGLADLPSGSEYSSPDFVSEDLFSSRMMSRHSSTHSSQMKTVGPAMSLRTSCWLLPRNEQ